MLRLWTALELVGTDFLRRAAGWGESILREESPTPRILIGVYVILLNIRPGGQTLESAERQSDVR
jgi:hypothetical protein